MSVLPSRKRTSVVDFVSAAGVVLSLIYVGYEIRENTNAVLQETSLLDDMASPSWQQLWHQYHVSNGQEFQTHVNSRSRADN